MSSCEPTSPNTATLVDVMSSITAALVSRVGTKIAILKEFDKIVVRTERGDFVGDTEDEAVMKFLLWLCGVPVKYTPDQIQAAAKEQAEEEQKKLDELLDELAAGGLSETGQAVEASARARTEHLKSLYETTRASLPQGTAYDIFDKMKQSDPDLEWAELLPLLTTA